MKVGSPFDDRWHEEDGFEHVENEIQVYDALKNVQGKVVPRVVAGGFDEYFSPRCMVLVTEKVGKCVEEEEDRLFADDVDLDQQDMLKLKEHALEGLNQICGSPPLNFSKKGFNFY